uniref:Uncharacterized protein n=1 Tax=Anopheles atroparvus TaxID=41427 RepID=A0AAG5DFN2_ANOAO
GRAWEFFVRTLSYGGRVSSNATPNGLLRWCGRLAAAYTSNQEARHKFISPRRAAKQSQTYGAQHCVRTATT